MCRQLMAELAAWRGSREADQLPMPLRAAILAHRFVTIHLFLGGYAMLRDSHQLACR